MRTLGEREESEREREQALVKREREERKERKGRNEFIHRCGVTEGLKWNLYLPCCVT